MDFWKFCCCFMLRFPPISTPRIWFSSSRPLGRLQDQGQGLIDSFFLFAFQGLEVLVSGRVSNNNQVKQQFELRHLLPGGIIKWNSNLSLSGRTGSSPLRKPAFSRMYLSIFYTTKTTQRLQPPGLWRQRRRRHQPHRYFLEGRPYFFWWPWRWSISNSPMIFSEISMWCDGFQDDQDDRPKRSAISSHIIFISTSAKHHRSRSNVHRECCPTRDSVSVDWVLKLGGGDGSEIRRSPPAMYQTMSIIRGITGIHTPPTTIG